ncbi:MAG: maleylpyruvate isomerase family mycothiol-dependent enzyme [Actinobacteria bacterium]|nr:maleylpyruvate isomerase family mycothiol-dependent enzyme [Actinomycetota bacterium]
MSDFGAAYSHCKLALCDVISSLTEHELRLNVPATPRWNVKDLFAHVVGIAVDFSTGNVAEVGKADWTQSQVDSRSSMSVNELIAEWNPAAEQVAGAMEYIHPAMAGLTLADAVVHEHDLRNAVGRHGNRDGAPLELSLNTYARWANKRFKDQGHPALKVTSGGTTWNVGLGDPQATVEAPPFDMFRALAGRRTDEELSAFTWTGEREQLVPLISNYGKPSASLGE